MREEKSGKSPPWNSDFSFFEMGRRILFLFCLPERRGWRLKMMCSDKTKFYLNCQLDLKLSPGINDLSVQSFITVGNLVVADFFITIAQIVYFGLVCEKYWAFFVKVWFTGFWYQCGRINFFCGVQGEGEIHTKMSLSVLAFC